MFGTSKNKKEWIVIAQKYLTFLLFLASAVPTMKLTFIYLANDVIQNSRKKGSEYSKVFAAVLPAAYKEASR